MPFKFHIQRLYFSLSFTVGVAETNHVRLQSSVHLTHETSKFHSMKCCFEMKYVVLQVAGIKEDAH